MNLSMPAEIRRLVRQAAISTAAIERKSVDDSAWIVRAVSEKLMREWETLALGEVPDLVRALGRPVPAPAGVRAAIRLETVVGGSAAAAA